MGLHKERGVYVATKVVNGQRFRKSLNVHTKQKAQLKYDEFLNQAKAGLIVANPTILQKQTFGDVLDKWIDGRRRNIGRLDKAGRLMTKPLSEKTLRTESERAVIVRRDLGHLRVSALTVQAIEAYINKRRGEGVANGTVNRELDVVRGLLRLADRAELIVRTRNLPPGETIGISFTAEQKARLIAAATRIPERHICFQALVLALNTGLRPAEMRGLRWRNVDLVNETLTLEKSKTKAGKRSIALNAAALAILRKREEEVMLIAGQAYPQDALVFFKDVDVMKPIGSFRTAWRSICREAGIGKCRFYDCRHTVVTELLQDPNVSEQTAKSIVGHVSRQMLERYSHERIEAKRKAVNAPTFGTNDLMMMPADEQRPNQKPN